MLKMINPYTGMHLMCTHNALGQEISDGGILTTEFMVANPGTGKTGGHRKMIEERFIDPVKFAATKSLPNTNMSGSGRM